MGDWVVVTDAGDDPEPQVKSVVGRIVTHTPNIGGWFREELIRRDVQGRFAEQIGGIGTPDVGRIAQAPIPEAAPDRVGIPLLNVTQVEVDGRPMSAWDAVVAPDAPLVYRNVGNVRELDYPQFSGQWNAGEGGFTVPVLEGDTQFTTDPAKAREWSHPLRNEVGKPVVVEADISDMPVRFIGFTEPDKWDNRPPNLVGDVFYPSTGTGIGVVGPIPVDRIRRLWLVRSAKPGDELEFADWDAFVKYRERGGTTQGPVAENPPPDPVGMDKARHATGDDAAAARIVAGTPPALPAKGDMHDFILFSGGDARLVSEEIHHLTYNRDNSIEAVSVTGKTVQLVPPHADPPLPPPSDTPPMFGVFTEYGEGVVEATVDGDVIGALRWDPESDPPEIIDISVDPRYQRRGIATTMLERARDREPGLVHSTQLTGAGRAWSTVAQGPLPEDSPEIPGTLNPQQAEEMMAYYATPEGQAEMIAHAEATIRRVYGPPGERNLLGTGNVDGPSEKFDDRITRCYELSAYALAFGEEVPKGTKLVHGTIHGPGAARRIGHGWLRLPGGKVWEPITAKVYDEKEWTEYADAKVERVYTKPQAMRMLGTEQTYGRWHESRYEGPIAEGPFPLGTGRHLTPVFGPTRGAVPADTGDEELDARLHTLRRLTDTGDPAASAVARDAASMARDSGRDNVADALDRVAGGVVAQGPVATLEAPPEVDFTGVPDDVIRQYERYMAEAAMFDRGAEGYYEDMGASEPGKRRDAVNQVLLGRGRPPPVNPNFETLAAVVAARRAAESRHAAEYILSEARRRATENERYAQRQEEEARWRADLKPVTDPGPILSLDAADARIKVAPGAEREPRLAAAHGREARVLASALPEGYEMLFYGREDTGDSGYADGQTFRGNILRDGRVVGHFEREFYPNGEDVFHRHLDVTIPGLGFGTQWVARSVEAERLAGYKRLHVRAGLESGGVVWAKAGFQFDTLNPMADFPTAQASSGTHMGWGHHPLLALEASQDPDVVAWRTLHPPHYGYDNTDRPNLRPYTGPITPTPQEMYDAGGPIRDLLKGSEWTGILDLTETKADVNTGLTVFRAYCAQHPLGDPEAELFDGGRAPAREVKAIGGIARRAAHALPKPKRGGWWAGTGFREELVIRNAAGEFSGRVGGIGAPDVGRVAQSSIPYWSDRDLAETLTEMLRASHFEPTPKDLENRREIVAEMRRRHTPNVPVVEAPIAERFVTVKCPRCNGTGVLQQYVGVNGGECWECLGTGVIERPMTPAEIAAADAETARIAADTEAHRAFMARNNGNPFVTLREDQPPIAEAPLAHPTNPPLTDTRYGWWTNAMLAEQLPYARTPQERAALAEEIRARQERVAAGPIPEVSTVAQGQWYSVPQYRPTGEYVAMTDAELTDALAANLALSRDVHPDERRMREGQRLEIESEMYRRRPKPVPRPEPVPEVPAEPATPQPTLFGGGQFAAEDRLRKRWPTALRTLRAKLSADSLRERIDDASLEISAEPDLPTTVPVDDEAMDVRLDVLARALMGGDRDEVLDAYHGLIGELKAQWSTPEGTQHPDDWKPMERVIADLDKRVGALEPLMPVPVAAGPLEGANRTLNRLIGGGDLDPNNCPTCKGFGTVLNMRTRRDEVCPTCNGSGSLTRRVTAPTVPLPGPTRVEDPRTFDYALHTPVGQREFELAAAPLPEPLDRGELVAGLAAFDVQARDTDTTPMLHEALNAASLAWEAARGADRQREARESALSFLTPARDAQAPVAQAALTEAPPRHVPLTLHDFVLTPATRPHRYTIDPDVATEVGYAADNAESLSGGGDPGMSVDGDNVTIYNPGVAVWGLVTASEFNRETAADPGHTPEQRDRAKTIADGMDDLIEQIWADQPAPTIAQAPLREIPRLPPARIPSMPDWFFADQVGQYPADGPEGVSYFKGVIDPDRHVDCLLFRKDGEIVGILNYFPTDFPEAGERAGNFTVLVHPDHRREGIATALVNEAITQFGADPTIQDTTPEGAAFNASLGHLTQGPVPATFWTAVNDTSIGKHVAYFGPDITGKPVNTEGTLTDYEVITPPRRLREQAGLIQARIKVNNPATDVDNEYTVNVADLDYYGTVVHDPVLAQGAVLPGTLGWMTELAMRMWMTEVPSEDEMKGPHEPPVVAVPGANPALRRPSRFKPKPRKPGTAPTNSRRYGLGASVGLNPRTRSAVVAAHALADQPGIVWEPEAPPRQYISPNGTQYLIRQTTPVLDPRYGGGVEVSVPAEPRSARYEYARRRYEQSDPGTVGYLRWYPDGEIAGVYVNPDQQRQGVATELLKFAREVNPEVHHSPVQSREGQRWAAVAAGPVPDDVTFLTDGELAAEMSATDMRWEAMAGMNPAQLEHREVLMLEYIRRHPQFPAQGPVEGGLPSYVAHWEATQPWNATRQDLERQVIPGIVVGRARGTEVASHENGKIVLKDEWFDLPEGARRAVLYHEAGHGLADDAMMNADKYGLDNPLDLYDWPGATRLGHNWSEIVAETYSVMWTEPSWFDEDTGKIRDLVAQMAADHGYARPPVAPQPSETLPAVLPRNVDGDIVTPGATAILSLTAYHRLFPDRIAQHDPRRVRVNTIGRGAVDVSFTDVGHIGVFPDATVQARDLFAVTGDIPPGYGMNGRRISVGSVVRLHDSVALSLGIDRVGGHGVVVGSAPGPDNDQWQVRLADGRTITKTEDTIHVTTITQKFDHLASEIVVGDTVTWVDRDGAMRSDRVQAVDVAAGGAVMVALKVPPTKRRAGQSRLAGETPVLRLAPDDPVALTRRTQVDPDELRAIRDAAAATLPDRNLIGRTRQNFAEDPELLRRAALRDRALTEAAEWEAWRAGTPRSQMTGAAEVPYERYDSPPEGTLYPMEAEDVDTYVFQSTRTAARLTDQYDQFLTYLTNRDPDFAKRGYRYVPDIAADGGPGPETLAVLQTVRDTGARLAEAVQARYQEKLDADKVADPDVLRARQAILTERLGEMAARENTMRSAAIAAYAKDKYGIDGDVHDAVSRITDRAERDRVAEDLFDGATERRLRKEDPDWEILHTGRLNMGTELRAVSGAVLTNSLQAKARRARAAQEILAEVRPTGGVVFGPVGESREPSLLPRIELLHPDRPSGAPLNLPIGEVEIGDKLLTPGGLATITSLSRKGPAPAADAPDARPWRIVIKNDKTRESTVGVLPALAANEPGATMSVFRGEVTMTADPDMVALKALHAALDLYPSDWVAAVAGRGALTLAVEDYSQRGSYNNMEHIISLPRSGDDVKAGLVERLGTATHEAGHMMEEAVPGLKALEWAYHTERTTDRTPTGRIATVGGRRKRTGKNAEQQLKVMTGQGYADWETARGDEYVSAYSGKEYDPGPTGMRELFTTMVESLLAGAPYGDDDSLAWTLGILAVL